MKLKIFLVFSIIFFVMTLAAVSAADNDTCDVSQIDDGEILEKTVSGTTFEDIQKTVSSCSDGDTVELKGTYTGSKSPVSVSKSITIVGNGATLDAKKKTSILKVTSKKLTLKNIKFTNSKGLAISSKKCNLEIINCTFTGNGGNLEYIKYEDLYTASCDYAGIYASGGKVTLIDSKFSANNKANIGLSVGVKNGQLNALRTTFSNHKLDYDKMSSLPEVIYLYNSKATFDNCIFRGNTVGTIYTNSYAKIDNCRFENNLGGVMFFGNPDGKITSNSQLDVVGTKFTGTERTCFLTSWAVAINIDDCDFTNNQESIIDSYSVVNIKNSRFSDNSAENGAVFRIVGKATVTNSTFIRNTAERGGVVYAYEHLGCGEKIDSWLTFIDSTIKDSSASVDGGAIYAASCNIKLVNTTISTQSGSKGAQISTKACTFVSIDSVHKPIKSDKFKLTVTYSNIKKSTFDSRERFEVSFAEKIDGEYSHVSYTKVKFKVYTGKKYKIYYYNGNNEKYPEAFFRITSELSVGKHKIVVMPNSKYSTFTKKAFTLKIEKAKTIVKAKKMTAKHNKSKKFKVIVKNRASKKVVAKIKIALKVYTGSKSRTYVLKTDKNGVAKFDTKRLSRGTHKVVIKSKNKNYVISKKSSIRIK